MKYIKFPAVRIVLIFLLTLTLAYSLSAEVLSKTVINEQRQSGPVRTGLDDGVDLLFGWPRSIAGEEAYWGRVPTILDIDSNRDMEISLLSTEGSLNVMQHDGASYPGFPTAPHRGNRPYNWVNGRHNSTSATGDFSRSGSFDIAYFTDIGYLHVVSEDGTEPQPFPLDFGRSVSSGVPALIDVDSNEELDIVVNVFPSHPDSVLSPARIHVLDNTGNEVRGFPVEYDRGSRCSPVAGDITGDGSVNIIIGNTRYLQAPAQIWAWRSNGTRVEGFPAGEFHTINTTPTLADLTGDGALEIVFWAAEFESDRVGIFAYDGRGQLLENFPFDCPVGNPEGSPAVSDIDDDGQPEIVFGSFNQAGQSAIYAWETNGSQVENFPLEIEQGVIGNVLIADVSGDSVCDIIAALQATEDADGQIAAWDNRGNNIEGFPLRLDEHNARSFAGTPTIWDVNLDGGLDIVAVCTDRSVFIWGTDGQLTDDVWLTFKGNMQRTGMRPMDHPGSVEREDRGLLPQTVTVDTWPNPFNSTVNLSFELNESGRFTVDLVDNAGRIIANMHDGNTETGRTLVNYTPADNNLAAGVYLCRWQLNEHSGVSKLLYIP